ncbi:type IV secretory system conjugative DNA transfer family protein [Spirillospora sp. CA-108201]
MAGASELSEILTEGRGFGERVALGRVGEKIVRSEPFRPIIVFGPQRSGKTTGIVIPAVLEWEGPCLVTSVRFDVVLATIEHRSGVGDVYIFDPTGLAEEIPALADYCVGWSPLDGISSWDDAVKRTFGLSESVSADSMTEGSFWIVSARQLLAPLLLAAAKAGGTMRDVLQWLGEDRQDLLQEIEMALSRAGHAEEDKADDDDYDLEMLKSTIRRVTTNAENTYTSIAATAVSMLEVFSYRSVDERCRSGGLNMDSLLNGGNNTLYICAPVNEQRLFRPLFTALTREVLNRTYSHNALQDSDREPIKILLCLDEAGNIARLEDLDTIATTAAGSSIQLVSIFHDMSQLSYCYSEDRANLIANNHSAKIFLPSNSDPRTNTFISAVVGDEDVRGLDHRGWSFKDLRRMEKSRALCIYSNLPPLLVSLRRSFDTAELLEMARTGDE